MAPQRGVIVGGGCIWWPRGFLGAMPGSSGVFSRVDLGHEPCWQMAARVARRSLTMGVTEGCEVQAGAGEEPRRRPRPGLHPFEPAFVISVFNVSAVSPAVAPGACGGWRGSG
jgi:hypothetical protein